MSIVKNPIDKIQADVEMRGQQATGKPYILLGLGVLACLATCLSIGLIFFYTIPDDFQGEVQRIFYFHVPASWVGMLAFVVLALVGIIYLFRPDERLDLIARASAEVGAVFLGFGLVLGSLWGRPVWGAWWVWDAKLTATLILWFMFLGYLLLRGYMGRTSASSRVGAVWGIVGVIDVPIIYLSVEWWRGHHPVAQVTADGGMPSENVLTLLVCVLAFTLLYAFLMMLVYQLQHLQARATYLRAMVEE